MKSTILFGVATVVIDAFNYCNVLLCVVCWVFMIVCVLAADRCAKRPYSPSYSVIFLSILLCLMHFTSGAVVIGLIALSVSGLISFIESLELD